MNDRASEGVKKALALDGEAERIKDYYRDWARTYDADVGAEDYRAPEITASLARLVHLSYYDADRGSLRIMDAGCGTGLAGVALKRADFVRIDGFDIAPAMVDAARATGAYENLLCEIDLNEEDAGLSSLRATYDIVTCAGVFTLGHVVPRGLDHLIEITRPGGFIIASTRDSYLERSNFQDHVAQLVAEKRISHVHSLPDANYVGADRADYWVYRRGRES